MTIYVNDTAHKTNLGISLKSFLDDLLIDQLGIAVAIDRHVISKVIWETYILTDQQRLTLIRATQGG